VGPAWQEWKSLEVKQGPQALFEIFELMDGFTLAIGERSVKLESLKFR
jgi:hypothetical protein